MGVLAGRIPRKIDDGCLVRVKIKLAGLAKDLVTFANNYGLIVAGQEERYYKHAPGIEIINALEQYGVDACRRGADFWECKKINKAGK